MHGEQRKSRGKEEEKRWLPRTTADSQAETEAEAEADRVIRRR